MKKIWPNAPVKRSLPKVLHQRRKKVREIYKRLDSTEKFGKLVPAPDKRWRRKVYGDGRWGS